MGRPEARLVEAGLRLWVDPGDRLAAAELARLVRWADDPDGFLASALHGDFEEVAEVSAVVGLRRVSPLLGVLAVVDEVMEALQASERALEWGDAEQRRANLDALRGFCVGYVERAGRGATVLGLLGHLRELAAEGKDTQAIPSGGDAVTVLTWHRSKGLEWPTVVLFDLDTEPRVDLFGARSAGEWIRFWPDPFRDRQTSSAFHARALAHPSMAAAREAAVRERLRLLYVGWTRARDRVVLAGRPGFETGSWLAPLGLEGVFDGVRIREGGPVLASMAPVRAGSGVVARGMRAHPLVGAVVGGEAELGAAERIGEGIRVSRMAAGLEEAVRAFFIGAVAPGPRGGDAEVQSCADEVFSLAAGLIHRHRLGTALAPRSLVRAGDAFRGWVERRWPGARWRRLWPV
jgi:hypothetical protein